MTHHALADRAFELLLRALERIQHTTTATLAFLDLLPFVPPDLRSMLAAAMTAAMTLRLNGHGLHNRLTLLGKRPRHRPPGDGLLFGRKPLGVGKKDLVLAAQGAVTFF